MEEDNARDGNTFTFELDGDRDARPVSKRYHFEMDVVEPEGNQDRSEIEDDREPSDADFQPRENPDCVICQHPLAGSAVTRCNNCKSAIHAECAERWDIKTCPNCYRQLRHR